MIRLDMGRMMQANLELLSAKRAAEEREQSTRNELETVTERLRRTELEAQTLYDLLMEANENAAQNATRMAASVARARNVREEAARWLPG
jgi:hypothetical protein